MGESQRQTYLAQQQAADCRLNLGDHLQRLSSEKLNLQHHNGPAFNKRPSHKVRHRGDSSHLAVPVLLPDRSQRSPRYHGYNSQRKDRSRSFKRY